MWIYLKNSLIVLLLFFLLFFIIKESLLSDLLENEPKVKTKVVKLEKWNKKIYQGERSYSTFGTNSVRDNYTGLIWQKSNIKAKMSWESAIGYCELLNDEGLTWRLPSIKELVYLADTRKEDLPEIAIDTNFFDIKVGYYWSATEYKYYKETNAWTIHFEKGNNNWNGKAFKFYVLCVSEG